MVQGDNRMLISSTHTIRKGVDDVGKNDKLKKSRHPVY